MMPHSDRAEPQGITIERLLQLKRAERPAPEFWDRFERELRTKQLAAIVEKRPWWMALRLPALNPVVRRMQVPVGAAALLAVAFLVISKQGLPSAFQSPGVRTPDAASHALSSDVQIPNVTLVATATPVEVAPVKSDSMAPSVMLSESSPGRIAATLPSPLIVANLSRASEPSGLMEMIPWAAAFRVEPRDRASRASTDYTDLPHVHFASAVLLGQDFDFSGRVDIEPTVLATRVVTASKSAAAQPVPAASLSSREVRRNRILSNLNVADPGVEGDRARAGQGREMLVSALDDPGLYDSVRRLGMGGDRLTLKF